MTVTLDYGIVGRIIQQLKEHGSWCGETHIQKTAFVAKDVLGVPLSASFVLYKHGPYSFDLNGILGSMRADRVLSLVPQGSYGPSFTIEPAMNSVFQQFQTELDKLTPKLQCVASLFGSKKVIDLERIATAIFVSLKKPDESAEVRAQELNRLKPHISIPAALLAVMEADHFLQSNAV